MEHTIRARVSEREKQIAEELAEKSGQKVSDYLRMLVHRDHERTLENKILDDLAKYHNTTPGEFLRSLIDNAHSAMIEAKVNAKGKKS